MVIHDIGRNRSDWIGLKLEKYAKNTVNILKYPDIKLLGNISDFSSLRKNNWLFIHANKTSKCNLNEN